MIWRRRVLDQGEVLGEEGNKVFKMNKIEKNKEQLREGQKVAEKAIWLEGGLVVAKIAIVLLSGSLALISDAIHSASDFLSIITCGPK